jgi:hypothetical protein
LRRIAPKPYANPVAVTQTNIDTNPDSDTEAFTNTYS